MTHIMINTKNDWNQGDIIKKPLNKIKPLTKKGNSHDIL